MEGRCQNMEDALGKKMVLAILALLMVLIYGCSMGKSSETLFTNLVTSESRKDLMKILKATGVSDVESFFERLEAFNAVQSEKSGMVSDLTPVNQKNYDMVEIGNAYLEKYPDKNDSNCRLTAFDLIKGSVEIKARPQEYGTYLMFDIDAIENDVRYAGLKDKKAEFIELFEQVPLGEASAEDFEKILYETLQKRGVVFQNEKISLIRVALHDEDEHLLFFGHAGVLFEYEGYYWFLEKLAPNEPYQFTRYANKNELKDELQTRPHYVGAESYEPIVVENNTIW